MAQKIPTIDPSAIANTKSGIGGIAVTFTSAMAAIITLIVNKSHFSEDLFLVTLIAILGAGGVATIYMFSYGAIERMLKLGAETKQQTTEILQNSTALSAMLEKQIRKPGNRLPSENDAEEASTSES